MALIAAEFMDHFTLNLTNLRLILQQDNSSDKLTAGFIVFGELDERAVANFYGVRELEANDAVALSRINRINCLQFRRRRRRGSKRDDAHGKYHRHLKRGGRSA